MKQKAFAAVDLGASNGRTILGSFDGQRLELEELNRFENKYVEVNGSYYWDVLHLFACIKEGLGNCCKTGVGSISGVGIDTWGVDFGLIDKHGKLVGNPRAYRDKRGLHGMKVFYEKYGERTAFDISGIANLEFNTIYQLYDMVQTGDQQLEIADKLLLMPDLLSYMLCGAATAEYTNATTTQMLDANGEWSKEILQMLGIKESLLPNIQMSAEKKGDMLASVAEDVGLFGKVPVYCVGSHDTASAVASIPATNDNYAFISSGTWSLIGIEREHALINDVVYKNNFSNEGAITGGVRLLRNIMGLWIIQNCKRQWDTAEKISWDDVVSMAHLEPGLTSFIDVNSHEFFEADDMVGKIQRYCADTGQSVPQTRGQIARTVYESLAMSYKEAFMGLEQIRDTRIDKMHIVGGGANNRMLNQMSANALNRPVVAGPTEATAIGNIMVQVKASGEVSNLGEMRQVIRDSFDVETYEPQDTDKWRDSYEQYLKIKKK